MFQEHGLPAFIEEAFIRVEGASPKFVMVLYQHPSHPGVTMLQLDALVMFADGRTLVESCAGWGADFDEALGTSLQNFSRYSLHPLLSAFFRHDGCNQVEVETWRIGDTDWTAHIGGLTSVDFGSTGKDPTGLVPAKLFPTIETLLKQQDFAQVPHWLRVYRWTAPQGTTNVEVLLDNEHWTEAEQAVAQLDWKPHTDAWQTRLFMALVPDDWTGA